MLSIAICDDEDSFCTELEKYLLKINNKYNVDVYYSGEDLCQKIAKKVPYDLIFLDIRMGKLNGIETGKYIRENLHAHFVQIVYVSAQSNYAMDLFEINLLHFLIKPLNGEEIQKVVGKAEFLLDKDNHVFKYKKNTQLIKKPIKEILYFSNEGRKVVMTDINNHTDEFYGKMEDVLAQLPNTFIQIHKSYIMNYHRATKITYEEVIMENGERLPISQSKRTAVRKEIAELDQEDLIFV
ncbi:MAG: LytTR family DNA-binding domain-containing protein [Dehalobacterium sp.]